MGHELHRRRDVLAQVGEHLERPLGVQDQLLAARAGFLQRAQLALLECGAMPDGNLLMIRQDELTIGSLMARVPQLADHGPDDLVEYLDCFTETAVW